MHYIHLNEKNLKNLEREWVYNFVVWRHSNRQRALVRMFIRLIINYMNVVVFAIRFDSCRNRIQVTSTTSTSDFHIWYETKRKNYWFNINDMYPLKMATGKNLFSCKLCVWEWKHNNVVKTRNKWLDINHSCNGIWGFVMRFN